MQKAKTIAWVTRIALLLFALAWAVVLHEWSRTQDPRFYEFVQTRPGRALARVFSWHGVMPEVPFAEKTEAAMTPGELAVRQELQAEIADQMPKHRLLFRDGEIMDGSVVEESADAVVFREQYGLSGELNVRVPRGRIERIDRLTNQPPPVSYRDVRFKMEFPGLHFYKRVPYSVMTDESYFRVEHIVRELQRLYRDFILTFGGLVTESAQGRDIQVVFFSDEQAYRAYQQKYASEMGGSAGFYSPWVDRLAVYNQSSAEQVNRIRGELAREEAEHRATFANQPIQMARLDAWRRETESRITRFAEEQTISAIRHEGAHQLFFSLGVHSINRIENDWLYEGLASYCETAQPGAADPVRVRALRDARAADRLLPLDRLVSLREKDGFMSFGNSKRIELTYAESWSLVRFLMEKKTRSAFFGYIRHVRDPANFKAVRETPAIELLTRELGTTPVALENEWQAYVKALVK